MIITVDNVEIVLSQSSDKTVTLFVEMRDGQTGRVYPKDLGKKLYSQYKIIATIKHGNIKTTVKMSYDHSLNTGENHYTACLLCLDKVKKQDEKDFSVLCYSYNEKNDGYSFTCKRIV